jgi:hypothetical protein
VNRIVADLILAMFLLPDRVRRLRIKCCLDSLHSGSLVTCLPFVRGKKELTRNRQRRECRSKKFHFKEINDQKMTKNVSIRLPEHNFPDSWLLEPHMSVAPELVEGVRE